MAANIALMLVLFGSSFVYKSEGRAYQGQLRVDRDLEAEFMSHRLELVEESLRTYVFESQPRIQRLQTEVEALRRDNKYLLETADYQNREIETLRWATSEIKAAQLTNEEKNLISEMQWKVWDLRFVYEQLIAETCSRSVKCFAWSEWSHCSVDCGSGTKIRSRECDVDPNLSTMCSPELFEETGCEGIACGGERVLLPRYDCPENYTSFQSYCFRFSGREDTRLLATITCEEEGAHLVRIDSTKKNGLVFDYLQIVAPEFMVDMHEDSSKREYWDFKDIDQKTNVAVDGIRRSKKKAFKSWRGQNMTFFNWADGQPRAEKNDGDYCVTMNVLTGQWYLECCGVTFYYVCETERRNRVLN